VNEQMLYPEVEFNNQIIGGPANSSEENRIAELHIEA
jgi:hypothetical protein